MMTGTVATMLPNTKAQGVKMVPTNMTAIDSAETKGQIDAAGSSVL